MEEKSLGLHATSLQKAQIQEKKNTFFWKLASWQEVQAFYLPTVATLQNKSNDIYKVELFLPSQIRNSLNWDDCLRKLGEYEWLLRQAQAQDPLSKMCDLLRLQDFLIKKKKLVFWCTAKYTLSIGDQQSTEKIQACTTKYHAAHSALHILAEILEKGSTWSMEFWQLNDDDVRALPTDG